MDIDGKWVGYGLGDNSVECKQINHRMLAAYPTHSNAAMWGLTETTLFGAGTEQALIDLTKFMNSDKASQLAAGTRGAKFPLRTDGVADLNVRKAIGAYVPPPPPGPLSIIFSINGAGSTFNMGYPWDIGELAETDAQGNSLPPAFRTYYHQPIGYNTSPVPMQKGVATGVTEFIRQLDMPRPDFGGRNCTQIPWGGIFYSMGAIVGMTVLMRVLYGDLQRFKATYMGSSAFGNPMRAKDHAYPGGIPVDGEGIATTTDYVIPDCHWDFTSSKGMVNSSGDDLYAKVGGADQFLGTNELTLADIRSVWHIVNTGNPLTLAEQVGSLVLSPSFSKFEGAFGAAWEAAQFFILQGLSPHTTYQFVQTRAGDSRSAWDQALWHTQDLVRNRPQPFAMKGRAA